MRPPPPSTTPLPACAVFAAWKPHDLGIEWDAANRLMAVKEAANMLASFTYDGAGRRSTKSAGGVTNTYIYEGAQFLEERPSGGSLKRYIYGPGIDRPHAKVATGTTSYIAADHLGSIVLQTDSAGTPQLRREYDPWGNQTMGASTSGYALGGHVKTGHLWTAQKRPFRRAETW
jgi:YD repeat-containing protein